MPQQTLEAPSRRLLRPSPDLFTRSPCARVAREGNWGIPVYVNVKGDKFFSWPQLSPLWSTGERMWGPGRFRPGLGQTPKSRTGDRDGSGRTEPPVLRDTSAHLSPSGRRSSTRKSRGDFPQDSSNWELLSHLKSCVPGISTGSLPPGLQYGTGRVTRASVGVSRGRSCRTPVLVVLGSTVDDPQRTHSLRRGMKGKEWSKSRLVRGVPVNCMVPFLSP